MASKLIGVPFAYIPEELLFSAASSNAKVMYGVLTRYINNEDRAWPTQETLTRRLSWSESTVRRAINELLRLGWLTKEQNRVNHGTWAANIYTLNTKPKYQRTKLRRHRRSNLTAGADQGKQSKPAGHNRRSNLTDRTRENEFRAKSNASRLGGAPRSPRLSLDEENQAGEMFYRQRGFYPRNERQEQEAITLFLGTRSA
jgi:hypothetical protein